MTEQILQANGLIVSYGAIKVLKSVSLNMGKGEIHAIIGPNGAGKTTLFKTLSGEILPSQGTIEIDGKRVERLGGHLRIRMGVGRTFQVARIFGENTVLQNVIVAVEARHRQTGRLWPFSFRITPDPEIQDEAMEALQYMGLEQRHTQIAGSLAYGDRKRLEFAMMLALRPTLLMLDEPTAGMSPADRSASARTIQRVAAERGVSVLLTEHDMDIVFELADRVTVLNYGEVIASGSPEDVRVSPEVRQIYLGHGGQHA